MKDISKNEPDVSAEQNVTGFDGYIKLGDSCRNEGNGIKAAEYYILATDAEDASIGSLSVERRIAVADTLFESEGYKYAIRWLDGLLSDDAVIRQGDCYLRLSEYDAALEKYQFVDIELLSEEQRLFVAERLAPCDPKEALWYYSKCASKDTDARIMIGMGDCYVNTDKFSEAIEQYVKSLSHKDDRVIGRKIADLLYYLKRYNEALDYYLKYADSITDEMISSCIEKCYEDDKTGDFVKRAIDLYESNERYDEMYEWCLRYADAVGDIELLKQKATLFFEKRFDKYSDGIIERIVRLTDAKYKKTKDYKFLDETARWIYERSSHRAQELYNTAIGAYTNRFTEFDYLKEMAGYLWQRNPEEDIRRILIILYEKCAISGKRADAAILAARYYEEYDYKKSVSWYEKYCSLIGSESENILLTVIDLYKKHDNVCYARSSYKNLAEIYLRDGDRQSAARLYADFCSECPDLDMYEFLFEYYREQDPDEAIKYFKLTLKHFETKIKADTVRGVIDIYADKLRNSADSAESTKYETKIKRLTKRLGDSLYHAGDKSSALDVYFKCDLEYLDNQAIERIIDNCVDSGDYKAASDWYGRIRRISLEIDPDRYLGDLCIKKGKTADAIGFYESYHKKRMLADSLTADQKAEYEKIALKLFDLYLENKSITDLRGLINEYVKAPCAIINLEKIGPICVKAEFDNNTKNAKINRILGDYYLSQNDYGKADLYYESLWNDSELDIARIIAPKYFQNEKSDKALKWCVRSWEVKKETRVAAWIGDMYREMKEYPDAITWYTRSHALRQTGDYSIEAKMAECYFEIGEKENAYRQYSAIPAYCLKDYPHACSNMYILSLEFGNEQAVFKNLEESLKYKKPNSNWGKETLDNYKRDLLCLFVAYAKNGQFDKINQKISSSFNPMHTHGDVADACAEFGVEITDSKYQATLGDFYLRNRNITEAKRWYIKSWSTRPDVKIAEKLERIYRDERNYSEADVWGARARNSIASAPHQATPVNPDVIKASTYDPATDKAKAGEITNAKDDRTADAKCDSNAMKNKRTSRKWMGAVAKIALGALAIYTVKMCSVLAIGIVRHYAFVILSLLIPFTIISCISKKINNGAKRSSALAWCVAFAQCVIHMFAWNRFNFGIFFDPYIAGLILIYRIVPVVIGIFICFIAQIIIFKRKKISKQK